MKKLLLATAMFAPSLAAISSDECGIANLPRPMPLLKAPFPYAEQTGVVVRPGDKLSLDLQACDEWRGQRICGAVDYAYHVLAVNGVPAKGWLFGLNIVSWALGGDRDARHACQDWIDTHK
jgi:hypothetical protein